MKLTTNILPKPSYCSFKFKIAVSLIQTVASVTESSKSFEFYSMTNMLLYIRISIQRRTIWNKIICCLWSCLHQREFNSLVLVFSAKLNYLLICTNLTLRTHTTINLRQHLEISSIKVKFYLVVFNDIDKILIYFCQFNQLL